MRSACDPQVADLYPHPEFSGSPPKSVSGEFRSLLSVLPESIASQRGGAGDIAFPHVLGDGASIARRGSP